MKKKNWIIPGLGAVIAVSFFLIVGFLSHAAEQKDKSTCCSQKAKNCASNTNYHDSGEMILENLSRQFLAITPPGY